MDKHNKTITISIGKKLLFNFLFDQLKQNKNHFYSQLDFPVQVDLSSLWNCYGVKFVLDYYILELTLFVVTVLTMAYRASSVFEK